MDEDSDDKDDGGGVPVEMEDADDKGVKSRLLEPEDTRFSGELADGVKRIRVSSHNAPKLLVTATYCDSR
jgi:methyl coenzyme M reductase subunit C